MHGLLPAQGFVNSQVIVETSFIEIVFVALVAFVILIMIERRRLWEFETTIGLEKVIVHIHIYQPAVQFTLCSACWAE